MKKTICGILAVLFALTLAGCARVPTEDEMSLEVSVYPESKTVRIEESFTVSAVFTRTNMGMMNVHRGEKLIHFTIYPEGGTPTAPNTVGSNGFLERTETASQSFTPDEPGVYNVEVLVVFSYRGQSFTFSETVAGITVTE